MFSCFVGVQERLAQEKSTVVALRQESSSKEEQLNKLRNTLKLVTLTHFISTFRNIRCPVERRPRFQISSENQDLLNAQFKNDDRIKQLEAQQTGARDVISCVILQACGIHVFVCYR